jgi:hypothetical protein
MPGEAAFLLSLAWMVFPGGGTMVTMPKRVDSKKVLREKFLEGLYGKAP